MAAARRRAVVAAKKRAVLVGCRFSARPLPATDAADIDVNEVGARIEADAPRLEAERRALHLDERAVGNADVRGHALHVQAGLRNTIRHRGYHRAGPRGAIAGKDLKRLPPS